MTTTGHHKNDSDHRPRTILIGTDAQGRDYLLKTETTPATIVAIDGSDFAVRDQLDGLRVDHVIATVADEIGWSTIEYGPRAHEKGVPRKYA